MFGKNLSVLIILITIINCVYSKHSYYTSEDRQTLEKFRERVKDVLNHDDEYEQSNSFLIRWLKANYMEIDDAEKMLREAKKWRRYNRIDSILKERILNLKFELYDLSGLDKEGCPVLIVEATKMDTRKEIIAGRKDKLIRYYIQMLENLETKIRSAWKIGRNVTQSTNILNFDRYNSKSIGCFECLQVHASTMSHQESYYPGTTKLIAFVNLPRAGVPLLEAVKQVMSPATRDAMHVFGIDKKEFAPFLRKYIDADQLPYGLGGTKRN